ncbi:helix-turn-helix domain-containing protein [Actinocorallia libanotica]|uniref:TetR/AcrR family transcriptional regulator n=1 Tax=Actinocorallia libanotica TaxID=46162 RepID=A0ABN1RGC3_9ACTN
MSSSRIGILQSARRLIAERGAAITMAEVARAAGVSRQAVYLHFSSRASLFMAVVRYMDEEDGIQARCQEALRAADPVEALRAFTLTWLRYAAGIRPVAMALSSSRHEDPDASAAWNDRMADLRAGFLAAVSAVASAGRLRPGLDVSAASEIAWAMTSVPVWEQLTVDCGRPPAEAEQHLGDAVINALTV